MLLTRKVTFLMLIVLGAACHAGSSAVSAVDASSAVPTESPGVIVGSAQAISAPGGATPAPVDSGSCLPLAQQTSHCPPDWESTIADKATFCAKNKSAPFFGAFRSTEACRGWLRYSGFVFDSGPRSCLYDGVTKRLAGSGVFDGKALYQEWTCGFNPSDFNDEGCPGSGCEQ
jgi:hypothetical protein